MSEFAPPSGPPPPKVPEGWKAVWNTQYSEWFYVNLHTKQSQWDKPTEPATMEHAPPPDAPPGYTPGPMNTSGAPAEKGHLGSNNPYAMDAGRKSQEMDDEAYARRLQEEENARRGGGPVGGAALGDRGAADSYYNQPGGYGQPQYGAAPQQYGQQYPPQDQYGQHQQYGASPNSKSGGVKGLLGKLTGKSSSSRPPQQYPPAGGYGGHGGYPPQGGYGGHGGYPPHGGMMGGGMPARRKPGMGAGGAAALGVGGGLLGGAMLAEAADGGDDGMYQENNYYGDDDMGGGDMGGGDMGDMGGDF